MTKAALIRHPGVLLRPDSNLYQFGLRVPTELRKHFGSPWALRCSLGTADLREANDKAKALQAEWAVRFESLRSGKPIPFDAAGLRAKLLAYTDEPPRILRRLQLLRRWSHEQVEQVFT